MGLVVAVVVAVAARIRPTSLFKGPFSGPDGRPMPLAAQSLQKPPQKWFPKSPKMKDWFSLGFVLAAPNNAVWISDF